ncbi:MAG: hypothetical protein AAB600_02420 [Patescibacteria group bacterium]
MEQQNQQPIQEKTESKAIIKTNTSAGSVRSWKFFAIVVFIAVVLSAAGILTYEYLCSFDFCDTRVQLREKLKSKGLVIQQEDQSCAVDADCLRVGTACSDCSCGTSVNKAYQKIYEEDYAYVCKNYQGPVCDFLCETPYPRCISNHCVLSAEPSLTDTSNWRIYRNEEFGFEVRYPNQFMFFPRTDLTFDIMNYDKFDPKFERGNMNGLRIFVAVYSDGYKNKQEVLATIETEDELGKRTFAEEYLKESYGKVQYVYFRNSRWTSGSGALLSGVFMPSHAIYDPQTGGLAIFQIQDPSGDFEDVTQQILSTFRFVD